MNKEPFIILKNLNIYFKINIIYKCNIYIHTHTIQEKEAMNLRESKGDSWEVSKGRREMM